MTLYDAFIRLQFGHIIIEVAILFPYLTSATFWSESDMGTSAVFRVIEQCCFNRVSDCLF